MDERDFPILNVEKTTTAGDTMVGYKQNKRNTVKHESTHRTERQFIMKQN